MVRKISAPGDLPPASELGHKNFNCLILRIVIQENRGTFPVGMAVAKVGGPENGKETSAWLIKYAVVAEKKMRVRMRCIVPSADQTSGVGTGNACGILVLLW